MKKKISLFLIISALIAYGFHTQGYLSFAVEATSNPELAKAQIKTAPPLYLPLNPPFVVNFDHMGTLRYLQISLEVMYHDQDILDKVTERMPAIRNALILLLSNQEYSTLSTLVGKQGLREEIRIAINDLIMTTEFIDSPSYEGGEIYFTNFVMQ